MAWFLSNNARNLERMWPLRCRHTYGTLSLQQPPDGLVASLTSSTALEFKAPAAACALRGAEPVFVNIEADTANIGPDLIEDAITEDAIASHTKATPPGAAFCASTHPPGSQPQSAWKSTASWRGSASSARSRTATRLW
ncbi:MAG TPA: hypothetical protein GX515_04885 [Firmicutes bacterium]|nr:hypothetical protein [Bacillota bacterium]